MSIYNWSQNADENATADSEIDMSEYMRPSRVNDGVRKLMARVAELISDQSPSRTSTGAANSYVVTMSSTPTTLRDGLTVAFLSHQTNTDAATLTVNGFGAIALRSTSGVDLSNGQIQSDQPIVATYIAATNEWLVVNSNQAIGGGVFDSRERLAETVMPSDPDAVSVLGYYSAGDGGDATYRRLGTTPSPTTAWHVQSADGAWWQLAVDGTTDVKALGAIGDGSTHPLSDHYGTLAAAQLVYPHATALTDETDWAAIQAGVELLSAVHIPAGSYLLNQPVTVTNRAISIYGDGCGASKLIWSTGNGIIVRQHTVAAPTVDINTSDYFTTRIAHLDVETTAQESGIGIDIAYSPDVVIYGRNEHLVRIEYVDLKGVNTRSQGWTQNIKIVDVNHAVVDHCNIVGRQDNTQASTSPAFYYNSTSGVEISNTSDEEINWSRVTDCRIKNVEYGVKVTGAGEGVVVDNCLIPVCRYGVWSDKTYFVGSDTDPQLQVTNSHINASQRCVYIKRMHEVQITGNLFYSFPYLEPGSWAGIEADTVLEAVIDGNIFEGFNSLRVDTLTAILGTDLRKSIIGDGNIYINVDVAIEMASASSVENVIRTGHRIPSTDVTDFVTYSGGALAKESWDGPKYGENSGIVTILSTATTVAAVVIGDIRGGVIYEAIYSLSATKGATGGNTIASLAKASGSATISLLTSGNHTVNVSASAKQTHAKSVLFKATVAGSLGLVLQATSAGSNSTVAAGDGVLIVRPAS